MLTYRYEVSGTASTGKPWTTSGLLHIDDMGAILDTPAMAMSGSYEQLTRGAAGKPPPAMKGPYHVTRILIEELKQ